MNFVKYITLFLLSLHFITGKGQNNDNLIRRHSAAADKIIPASAKVEKIAGGFKFTEGPLWMKEGFLIFSDIPENTIFKLDKEGKVSTYIKPSGNSNGLTLSRDGRLLACQEGGRKLVSFDKEGNVAVLSGNYNGKRFNGVNDLVEKSDGGIYFTDPPWALGKDFSDHQKELDFFGIYRSKEGKTELLEKSLKAPNGIALSPDEKYLYVSDMNSIWMRYEFKSDGTLTNGKVFIDGSANKEPGYSDGLKVDVEGNVYLAAPGGFWIVSPGGEKLATVALPEIASNLCWGDEDGKTLYITAQTGIYRIKLNIEGIRPSK